MTSGKIKYWWRCLGNRFICDKKRESEMKTQEMPEDQAAQKLRQKSTENSTAVEIIDNCITYINAGKNNISVETYITGTDVFDGANKKLFNIYWGVRSGTLHLTFYDVTGKEISAYTLWRFNNQVFRNYEESIPASNVYTFYELIKEVEQAQNIMDRINTQKQINDGIVSGKRVCTEM